MGTIIFLIVFPLLAALILLFVKSDKLRGPTVIFSAALIAVGAVVLTAQNFGKEPALLFSGGGFASEATTRAMMGIEAALALLIVFLGIKHKKYLASVLAIVQCPLLIWFELTKGHEIEVEKNLYVDNFSMIMVLIIG
ncbi:MAG: NADH-quinone oxidoreductase subunit L, partial [Clostridiales Family XIII bacterium]|nr:NADH-quinone oxidoreductase subunit L [Clostridiales Family XIII bacterium]